jgi:uncharacterized membrane protein YccC
MVMAASIMVSIFSTHDRPSVMLSYIFCGASLGVLAAFICRLILLPGASDPLLQAITCIPVLMIGMIALCHRRTAFGAMDFMLFFLFVMQPGLATVPSSEIFVAGGVACLGGIVVAILVFRFLLPVDPERRLRSLLTAMVNDLNTMIAAKSLLSMAKCRARTYHRVLRMLANAGKLSTDISPFVEGGLEVLAIGRRIYQLRSAQDRKGCFSAEAMSAVRLRLSTAIQQPETSLAVLREVAAMLYPAIKPLGEGDNQSVTAPLPDASIHAAFPGRDFVAWEAG